MLKNLTLLASAFLLTSCNIWGGIDSPSGDAQILSAARGCFDRADYVCAGEYYAKLSTGMNDTRLSETAFVKMAENGIFSVSDLVASLGDGRGSGNSINTIAVAIAARGKTAGTLRVILDEQFVAAGGIVDTHLRAYTRFMIALAMTAQVLSNAVGSDGVLSRSDIAADPTQCVNTSGVTGCTEPVGTALVDNGLPGSWAGSATDANWGTTANLDMFITASQEADTQFNALSGSGLGVVQALGTLGGLGNLPAPQRLGMLQTLFQ